MLEDGFHLLHILRNPGAPVRAIAVITSPKEHVAIIVVILLPSRWELSDYIPAGIDAFTSPATKIRLSHELASFTSTGRRPFGNQAEPSTAALVRGVNGVTSRNLWRIRSL